MKPLRPLLALFALATVACSASPLDDDASDAQSELKKKVSPQGTEGTFELTKPAWATPSFDDGLSFAGRTIKLGDVVPKPPGTYALSLGASSSNIVVTAGASQQVVPAGLVLRYANPVDATWFASDQEVVVGPGGYVIRTGTKTVSLAVHPGQYDVSATGYAWHGAAAAGKLTELVMPTASLVVQVDPIDPAFPSTSYECLRLRALRNDIDRYPNYTASRWSISPPLRELASGTVHVPAGNAVRLYAGTTPSTEAELAQWPVLDGTTTTITINRLEVDDVASPTAGAARIRGTFNVEMKKGTSWVPYTCGLSQPTHTGVDLPNGSYRVTTVADGPTGRITHVEEVSFP